MTFVLRYESNLRGPQDPKPIFSSMVLRAEGEAFYIETELVVFHESFQTGSLPLYAATLSNLHYIERRETNDGGPGFEVSGAFPSGEKIKLWAGEARTFYCEQGFAVFYERPDRSGKQTLAVRCSDAREIKWLPHKESSQ